MRLIKGIAVRKRFATIDPDIRIKCLGDSNEEDRWGELAIRKTVTSLSVVPGSHGDSIHYNVSNRDISGLGDRQNSRGNANEKIA
jgi:hypothetical protein